MDPATGQVWTNGGREFLLGRARAHLMEAGFDALDPVTNERIGWIPTEQCYPRDPHPQHQAHLDRWTGPGTPPDGSASVYTFVRASAAAPAPPAAVPGPAT